MLAFVSDVHLAPGDPSRAAEFLEFARRIVEAGGELFVLGDLVEYWLGPRRGGDPDYATLWEGLSELRRRAARVHFVEGNRDFLFGWHARPLGRLPPAQLTIERHGRRIRLEHGDMLLNVNTRFSAYRRFSRLDAVRQVFTGAPLGFRRAFARAFRVVSRRTTPPVAWDSRRLFRRVAPLFRAGVDVVVCGHIHRPGHWAWDYRGRVRELVILGDWRQGGQYAVWEAGRVRLVEGGNGAGPTTPVPRRSARAPRAGRGP